MGELAKTDRIDARIIAQYAAVIRPEVRPAANQNSRLIRDLLARRRQRMTLGTMEKNRVQIMPKNLRADIQRHVRHCEKQVEMMDRLLDEMIEAEWRE